jgi:CxxC-x17-CxxC domain-containing protein
MADFRKPHGNGGGNRRFGPPGGERRSFDRPAFGGRRDENREMFPAVCDSCHKPFELPFRPNGKKPVYCSDCFAAQRGETPRRDTRPAPGSFERRDFARPSTPAVFTPQAPNMQNTEREIAALKRQMDIVTTKLDTILRLLESTPKPAPIAEEPKQMLMKPIPKEKLVSAKKKPVGKKKSLDKTA